MLFTADGDRYYEGQPCALRWNGWQCPTFDEQTARQIMQDYHAEPDLMLALNDGQFAVGSFVWTWYEAE